MIATKTFVESSQAYREQTNIVSCSRAQTVPGLADLHSLTFKLSSKLERVMSFDAHSRKRSAGSEPSIPLVEFGSTWRASIRLETPQVSGIKIVGLLENYRR